ncbi:calcium-binding protein [Methylobacterium sp. 77]|uniref:beta strand repeat-containing protein n=1 Tax=Methylobacterium sp. 77 TaxID=1101192 RepID=UPI0003686489|nr:calcium-binding protein [Methylobacterium sp. 77]
MSVVDLTSNSDTYVNPLGRSDTINGLAGDDLISGSDGNDTINGGIGTDFANYATDFDRNGTGGIIVNLATGKATDGFGNTDTLISIEGAMGSRLADRLTGGNVLNDGSGEYFYGLGGKDVIDGGSGYDEVRYDKDAAFGGMNGVTVNLTTGKAVDGFGTVDVLRNIEAVRGTAFVDRLSGGDTVDNGGSQFFVGLAGKDVIDGGAGYDEVRYDKDAGFGGTSGVTVNFATGKAVDGFGDTDTLKNVEAVRGTQFADHFIGGNQASDIFGEYFYGLGGNDVIDGGTGYDEVRYDKDAQFGGTRGVVVDLSAGTATDGFGATDTLSNIEGVRGTQFADRLHGNEDNDRSFDSLYGLAGDDTLDGGGGNDVARYDKDAQFGGTQGVTVNLAQGTATDGFGNHDTLISIEAVRGTQYADTLTGGNTASAAYEAFYGLAGNDTINGGGGFDEVRYDRDALSGGTHGVVVNLTTGTATDGFGNTDTLTGIEAVVGTDSNDTLTGSSAANRFSGHAGNDTIDGGAGVDTLDFRNDDLFGATHGAIVDLAAGTATDTSSGADTLTSIESVVGSVFADTMSGSASANTLTGGAGADWLDGRTGKDVLTGGTGSDTFHFSTAFTSTNVDQITDFETIDVIEIAQAIATALPVGTLAAAAFKDVSTGAVDTTDRILYDKDTGTLSYDKDGSGSAKAVVFAVLDHPIALTNLDFHIV